MINQIHITAKGMPAAHAAAGQRAPMLISVGMLQAFVRSAVRMLGLSNVNSLDFAVCKSSNYNVAGFGYTNPPHRDDNSPGKARLKPR
jgi:hypothetical protein